LASDGRIREPRFRQGAGKEVDYSAAFEDRTALVGNDPEVTANLLEIIRCIGAGNLIPEACYRNGIDRDDDPLLEEHGIKHLHLHADTEIDALLFLVEYSEFVLLLAVDGHRRHFNKPAGAVLRSLHDSAMRNADAKALRILEEKRKVMKGALRPRGGETNDE
jgi:hypothetical protein